MAAPSSAQRQDPIRTGPIRTPKPRRCSPQSLPRTPPRPCGVVHGPLNVASRWCAPPLIAVSFSESESVSLQDLARREWQRPSQETQRRR
jgi:hypothetical protein